MTTESAPELQAVLDRIEAVEEELARVLARNGAGQPERLLLHDAGGRIRAWLGLLDDGSPGLILADQEGKERIALTVAADGSPALGLYDAAGRARARLDVEASGPALTLYDGDGNVLARLSEPARAAETEGPEGRLEAVAAAGRPLSGQLRETAETWARQRLQQLWDVLARGGPEPSELRRRTQEALRALAEAGTRSLVALEEQVSGVIETIRNAGRAGGTGR